MRITENVEEIVIVKETKSIVCNCCGKVSEPNYSNLTQEFNIKFGYDSRYESSWGFDLCEECLTKIVKTFKVVPSGFMSEPSYTSSFDTDHELHQKLFEEWQRTGEWNAEDENPYKEYYESNEEKNECEDIKPCEGLHIVK